MRVGFKRIELEAEGKDTTEATKGPPRRAQRALQYWHQAKSRSEVES